MATPDRALALRRYLEASKLAFADRNRWVGDPAFVSVPLEALLSKDFAGERRCLIGATALPTPVAPGDVVPPYAPCAGAAVSVPESAQGLSTNHLTVVDRYGNVVSYTTTIEQSRAAGSPCPATASFSTTSSPTSTRRGPPEDPNLPVGGKRPRSSMAPTIVLQDGRPLLGVGSPGGSTIITTVLQILLDRLDFGMSLPDAIEAPRASQRNTSTSMAEPAFISIRKRAEHAVRPELHVDARDRRGDGNRAPCERGVGGGRGTRAPRRRRCRRRLSRAGPSAGGLAARTMRPCVGGLEAVLRATARASAGRPASPAPSCSRTGS